MNAWNVVVVLVAMAASAMILFRVPRLVVGDARGDDLLVVIPARNEAGSIHLLLDDLAAQTVRPARVVVVDDASEDDTWAVVERAARRRPDLPLELRGARPRPPAWNPKSWAIQQAIDGTEPWLLFLDADVRLAPEALASISAARSSVAAGDGTPEGLLSVAPRHVVGSVVEGLSLPFNLVAIMGATRPTAHRGVANAAFGPCLLVSRATYDVVGGHAAVHRDLLDDVALAQQVRASGREVHLRLGSSLVGYRMYPHGWRAVIEGWTKNIASGATRVAPAAGAACGLWVTATLLPLWLLATADDWRGRGGALVLWCVVAAFAGVLARRIGRFGPLPVVLAPLGALVFAIVAVRSGLLLAAHRPVRWKGRVLTGERGIVDG